MHSLVELYVLPSLNKEQEKSMHPIVEAYVAPSFYIEQEKVYSLLQWFMYMLHPIFTET